MRLSRLAVLVAVFVAIPSVALAYPPSSPPPPSRPSPSAAFAASQRASSLRSRGWLTGTRGGLRRPDAFGPGVGAGLLHGGLPSGPSASTLSSSRAGVDQYNVREGDRVLRFRFARPAATAMRAPTQLTVGRMRVPVRAVLFDIDGTLVDTRQTIADGIRAGLRALDLPQDETFVADQTRGRAFVDVAADAVHRFSSTLAAREPGGQLSPARAGALEQQFLSHAAETTESAERNGRASAYPGAVSLLNSLRSRGVGIIAVTSRPTASAQALLQRYGLGGRFDVIVGRQQASGNAPPQVIVRGAVRNGMPMAGKPAPSTVLYGLRLFGGVHPSETVFVGDMHTDLQAAAGAGVAAVGIGHGMDTPAMLRSQNPTAFVDDMSQLRTVLGLGAADSTPSAAVAPSAAVTP